MTTFSTTAAKVKVNGQWTPLLALDVGSGGGGTVVNFYHASGKIVCDKTIAEIHEAAGNGPVVAELDGNVYQLVQHGSSFAYFIYYGDYGFGGGDYYVLGGSSWSGENWELYESWKADIQDIQDEDGNSLINDDHIAVIPGGGGGHVAVFGETTFDEVFEWFNSGEGCVCYVGDVEEDPDVTVFPVLPLANFEAFDSTTRFIFSAMIEDGAMMSVTLDPDDQWDGPSVTLMETQNLKIASGDDWVSNETNYPSTAAVEDYVAEHAGGDSIPCQLTWTGGTLQSKAWNSGSISGSPNIDSMYPYEDFDTLFTRVGNPTSTSYNVGSMQIYKNVYPNSFNTLSAVCLHEGKAVFSFPKKWEIDNQVGKSNWLTKMLAFGYGVYSNMAYPLYKTNSAGNTVITDGKVFSQTVSNGEPGFNTGCQVLYDETHLINGSYTITDPLDEHIYDVHGAIFPAFDESTFIGIEVGCILIDRNTSSPGKWNKICFNSGVMSVSAPYVTTSSSVDTKSVIYIIFRFNPKNKTTYTKARETTKFAIPFLYSSTSLSGDYAKIFTKKPNIGLIPASTTSPTPASTCVHVAYGDMIPAPYYNGGIQSMQIEQVSKGIMLSRDSTAGYPLKTWSGIKMNDYDIYPTHHRFMIPNSNSISTVVYKSQSDEIKITNKNGNLSSTAYSSLAYMLGALRWYNGRFSNKLAGFVSSENSIPMFPVSDTGGSIAPSVSGYKILGSNNTLTGYALPYVSDTDPWMTLKQLQADGTTKTYNVHPFWSYRPQGSNTTPDFYCQLNIHVGLILKDPNKAWSEARTDDNDCHRLVLLRGGFKNSSIYAYNVASSSLSQKSTNYVFFLDNTDIAYEQYTLAHFTDYGNMNPLDFFKYDNTFAFCAETQVKYDCCTFEQIPNTTSNFLRANNFNIAACTLSSQLDPGTGPSSCGLSTSFSPTSTSMGFGTFMQLWDLGYNQNNRRDNIAFPKHQMQWQSQNVPGAETNHHDIFMDLSYINATWESSSSTLGLTLQWTKVYPDFDNGVFYVYGCKQVWAANPVDMTVTQTVSNTYKKQISMINA